MILPDYFYPLIFIDYSSRFQYNTSMTKDDLYFLIQTKTTHEFIYKGKSYNLLFDKDEKGEYIRFGLLYEEKKYKSFGELWNNAKIDNYFFREMLDVF